MILFPYAEIVYDPQISQITIKMKLIDDTQEQTIQFHHKVQKEMKEHLDRMLI